MNIMCHNGPDVRKRAKQGESVQAEPEGSVRKIPEDFTEHNMVIPCADSLSNTMRDQLKTIVKKIL